MPSLEHLIDHYTRFPDGLPCSLISPVGKMSLPPVLRPDKFPAPVRGPAPPRHIPKPPITSTSSSSDDVTEDSLIDLKNNNPSPGPPPPRIPTRSRIPMNPPQNLKPIDRRKSYENNDTLRRVRHSRDNIPRESIDLVRNLSENKLTF